MRTFYYVHTGHRIGLDRFRRACAIINSLGDVDITLLCSDFRIAQIANKFGIKNAVGLDVVRNIPQISHFGDQIIFDSEEANPIMLDDMRNYFSTFIRVSDSIDDKKDDKELLISPYLSGDGICNSYAVDDKFFKKEDKTIKLSFFFGDDDYSKDLEKNLDFLDGLNPDLQLGFYYFLDYEDSLKEKFENYHEAEDYEEMIKKTDVLITASPQAVLESLASGGKPIYFQREDYTRDFNQLFKSLNIPIIYNYDNKEIIRIINTINDNNYSIIVKNGNIINSFIKTNLIF